MNKTIGAACNITTGKLDANQAVEGGQFPFFTCAQYPGTIDHFAFDRDVVLVAGNNASGNFHVSRFNGKFNAYQRTYVLSAKDGFDIDFIYYALKLELKRLREKSQGSQTKFLTMPILTGIHFQNLGFDEQSAISGVLKVLDAKIDCNNRINKELEAVVKTLYEYWFVQFEFPSANGKPYKSSGGSMVYNAMLRREIPADWIDGTLNDLGQIVGGSTPSTKNPDNFTAKGTPWITPNDLSDNQGNKFITRGAQDVSDEGIKDASLKKYPAGTVLLSSRAPIGYMAIARAELTTNQGFKSFVPSSGYSSAFIYYTVSNSLKAITQYSSGSTFKEISAAVLKTVKITLPERSVAANFTECVEPIFRRQDLLEQENQQLTQLRDWLLPMLMSGQITVA
ncbi:restriction endonuclease subunit S [Pseudomonas syringae]|uniref:restriction endonuclease subunit S n=1 Tax=Pseudomonas syringae TaxID=317 RepID=UPI001F201E95|nr:restriction endonuclease subunit S [Pseudomonas syringae]MCF5648819.1 restriction endonuclease subunit S [Pseudomonas syringae]